MSGEIDLKKLLQTLRPELHYGEYVFCTTNDLGLLMISRALMTFREHEGITLILEKSLAESWNLKFDVVFSWITLTVHSSLEAVGLTAAFAKALTKNNISCNVVAGFYHDHIFVKQSDTPLAVSVLNSLSK
jgi:hypothetical protein